MRVLYVDAYAIHLNPTATYLPALFLETVNGTRFYGPGFSCSSDLVGGLVRWIDRTGPYDVIVVGPNTPVIVDDESSSTDNAVAYLKHFSVNNCSGDELGAFFKDVQRSLSKLPIPIKLVSALTFDYYAASAAQVERLSDSDLTVLGPNEQFIVPMSDLPGYINEEKHFRRKMNRLSDRWMEFLAVNSNRVVTALHYIASHEFDFTSIANRPTRVSIPGVQYFLRRTAFKRLKKDGIAIGSNWQFHAFRVGKRLGLPVYSRYLSLRLYNLFFQRTLGRSRFVYTARGGFGIPIRKFFEIPASGAVLVCVPCNAYDALGFRGGEHYFHADPEHLAEALEQIEDSVNLQRVADNGRRLVAERHSLLARGRQIASCLSALVAGRYRGARWEAGEFRMLGNE